MLSTSEFKKQAASMKTRLSALGIELSHAQALEGLAAAHGFRNWHACSSQLGPDGQVIRNWHPILIGQSGVGKTTLGTYKLGFQVTPPEMRIQVSNAAITSHLYGMGRTGLGLTELCLGIDSETGKRVELRDSDLSRHIVLCGQSGYGRAAVGLSLLDQQQARGGGWIFVDDKLDVNTRDDLKASAERRKLGESFLVLNIEDPATSNTYNPLVTGSVADIVDRLMALLPRTEASAGADVYWSSIQYALTVTVGALKAAQRPFTFEDISVLLQSGPAMEQLLAQTPANLPEHIGLDMFLEKFRPLDARVADSQKMKEVLGGMTGRIGIFSQGKFGKVFNTITPDIDMVDILLNKKYLYVMLPTMGNDVQALMLGKMVLSDIRSALYQIQKLSRPNRQGPPALVYLEGAASYGSTSLPKILEIGRGAGVGVMLGFQSLSEFSNRQANFERMIVQNSWSKIYLHQAELSDATACADLLGFTDGRSASGLVKDVRHWATPQELMQLKAGEALVITGGQRHRVITYIADR